MKIMRSESWRHDWSAGPTGETMQCGMRSAFLRGSTGLRVIHFRRLSMQWTTPTACDLRFGFEITMYVSAR
jgi:coenzyme PQQ precursor peptide PqqA